jgi:transcriptional regulator with XRE-family HTH domain
MSSIQVVFSENMKKYRREAGLTQEKLAEKCGTDHRYIGQIETGVRCPSLDYVERIAAALKIAPYRLFYEKSDTEDESRDTQFGEQKQKIKTMLLDNVTKICSMLDEN